MSNHQPLAQELLEPFTNPEDVPEDILQQLGFDASDGESREYFSENFSALQQGFESNQDFVNQYTPQDDDDDDDD